MYKIGKKNNRKILEILTFLSCKQEMVFNSSFFNDFLAANEKDFHGMHTFPLWMLDGQIMSKSDLFYAKNSARPEKAFPEIRSTRRDIFS